MVQNRYHYALELFTEDGSPVGQIAMPVDFEPARECVRFSAIRKGALPTSFVGTLTSVQPLWHSIVGEPYVDGFRILLATATNGQELSGDFTTAYFKRPALRASAYFVEKGRLASGDKLKFLVVALPCQEDPPERSKLSFSAEEIASPLPIRETSLAEFTKHSVPMGILDADLFPVVIPRQVLNDALAITREVGDKETGGVLIGHLHRDPTLSEILVEVTAQLRARHTEATVASLTFTSEAWTDVRAALQLRKKEELMIGWWHSHVQLCRNCPIERQRVCRLARDYYSDHDYALHRAVFPRAYSIGLVVNDVGLLEPTFSLFGWKNQGILEPRGFYVRGEGNG
jgi:hypothetical protein